MAFGKDEAIAGRNLSRGFQSPVVEDRQDIGHRKGRADMPYAGALGLPQDDAADGLAVDFRMVHGFHRLLPFYPLRASGVQRGPGFAAAGMLQSAGNAGYREDRMT